MIKSVLKDSVIYGVGTVASRAISFFLLPLYTAVLTPSDYGVLELISIVIALAMFIGGSEITQAVARYAHDYEEKGKYKALNSTAIIYTVIGFTIVCGILIIFRNILSIKLFSGAISEREYYIAVVWLFLWGLSYYVQNELRWKLQPLQFTIVAVLYSLLSAGGNAVAVLVWQLGIEGIFLSNAVASLVSFIVGLYYGRSRYALHFDTTLLREMLSFSAPLIIASVVGFGMQSVDRLVIKKLLGVEQVGIYAIGVKIASVVGTLLFTIQSSVLPRIYAGYKEENAQAQVSRTMRFVLGLSLVLLACFSMFARELIAIMSTAEYQGAAVVIPYLVSSTIVFGLLVFAPGLSLANKTGIWAAIMIGGSIFNIGLEFLLIPLWGIEGAALSSLVTYSLVYGVTAYLSQKTFPINISFRSGISVILWAVFLLCSSQYVNSLKDIYVVIALKSIVIICTLLLVYTTFGLFASEDKQKLRWFIQKRLAR